MQYHWLNKQKNEKLIIFFSGWSFDYHAFERLDCRDYDVFAVYDYTEIAEPKEDFSGYKQIFLISWSMGVFSAWRLRNSLPDFVKKIAINGTSYPIDDKFGIPEKIFNLTLKNFNQEVLSKFQKNMFSEETEYKEFLASAQKNECEKCKKELLELESEIKACKETYSDFYDCSIISRRDKIFPYKNQVQFWEKRAKIVFLSGGHFPFVQFKSWNDILRYAD